MEKGLVSIITPMYKGAAFVGETIESVLNQTYANWEMIIVDDCSPDDGAGINVVKSYNDPRIKLIESKVNKGSSGARNIALREAKGQYIAFLDSDDLWLPKKLEKQISFMEDIGAEFSCTAYRQMDVEGNDLHTIMIPPKKITYRKCIQLSNPIGNLTVMYNQDALGKFTVPLIKKRNDFAGS